MTKIFSWDARKGTLIDDVSKTQGTLTKGNGGFVKSEKGTALKYDGTEINWGNLSNLTGIDNFTIIAWYQNINGDSGNILTKGSYYRADASFFFGFNGTNMLASLGMNTMIYKNWSPEANKIYQVAFTYSKNPHKLTFWIDNTIFKEGNAGTAVTVAPSNKDVIAGSSLKGSLLKVQMFDTTFTQTEMNNDYKEFLRSYPQTEQKDNFVYPKATDLSNEVESHLSEEKSTNGTFDSDTGWNKQTGWTISGGTANCDGTQTSTSHLYQENKINSMNTVKYLISYTISNYQAGSVRTYIGGSATGFGTPRSANGTYTEILTISPNNGNINITADLDFIGSIDNLSVKAYEGLVASYNMTPSPGNVLVDTSGNGNNGTIYGASQTVKGMKFKESENSGVEITTINPSIFGNNATICHRFKFNSLNTGTHVISSIGDKYYSNGYLLNQNGKNLSFYWHDGGNAGVITDIFEENTEYTLVYTNKDGVLTLYINGVSLKTGTSSGAITNTVLDLYIGGGRDFKSSDMEMIDSKFYNYAITPQQVKAYHNSFIKPTKVDRFKLDSVDEVPSNWKIQSGDYTVQERVIKQGELINNGDFATDVTGWSPLRATIAWETGGFARLTSTTLGQNRGLRQTGITTIGKRYRLTFDAKSNDITADFFMSGLASGINVIKSPNLTPEWQSYIFEFTALFTEVNAAVNNVPVGKTYNINNVSLVEIPALPGQTTGDKFLQCDSNGIISTQSNTAYGEWEWDYKPALSTGTVHFIANNTKARYSFEGYLIATVTDGRVLLNKSDGTSSANLIETDNNYFDSNTQYRFRVQRLANEGVFKDIETLQVSDCMNYNYDSFTDVSRYGFKAVKSTTLTGDFHGGTKDELSIVSGAKYQINFNLKNNGGSLPLFRFSTTYNAGSSSNVETAVEGDNSFILTATGTSTMVLDFLAQSLNNYDYEISNLSIRRIYDVGTFAVYIKGGDFGDDYTLVDTTGGSGTNPVTDNIYTESKDFVIDADTNDTFSNLVIKSGVEK